MLINISLIVKRKLTEKGISIPQLASELGMTKQNLYAMLNNNDLKISVLEKISQILNIPVLSLLDEKNLVQDPAVGYQNLDINERLRLLENRIIIIEQNQILINQKIIEQ